MFDYYQNTPKSPKKNTANNFGNTTKLFCRPEKIPDYFGKKYTTKDLQKKINVFIQISLAYFF